MPTRIRTVCCCVLAIAISVPVYLMLANSFDAVAADKGVTLHPNDGEALRAARIAVKHEILNQNEHAFEITAEVPEGFQSLDSMFQVRNDKGLVTYSYWGSSEGKCVAVFMVGEQALKDALFTVHHHEGDPNAPFANRVGYALKLSEFAVVNQEAPAPKATLEDFEVSAPITKKGAMLQIELKLKETFSNWHYDVHLTTTDGLDQHFDLRNGQSLAPTDVRLADLTADGFLDIMIVGGKDHRGEEWFKTLLYDSKGKEFRWIKVP